jgi:hypothetical protein
MAMKSEKKKREKIESKKEIKTDEKNDLLKKYNCKDFLLVAQFSVKFC